MTLYSDMDQAPSLITGILLIIIGFVYFLLVGRFELESCRRGEQYTEPSESCIQPLVISLRHKILYSCSYAYKLEFDHPESSILNSVYIKSFQFTSGVGMQYYNFFSFFFYSKLIWEYDLTKILIWLLEILDVDDQFPLDALCFPCHLN